MLCLWVMTYFFKFLANAIEDVLCIILLVSCFYSIANLLQDKYLFYKPFIMSYTSIASDISMKSEERVEFELSAFIYMSLSHDSLYFELIVYCTGCAHKQVMVGNSFYYQTYGSVSPVQSSASYT